MPNRVLVIAGVLLAAGTVAAVSAPHFRGAGAMHGGARGLLFGELGDDLFGGSEMRLGERLKELDTNRDGVITLEEFLSRRVQTFGRLDRNTDGVIDRAEFEAAARESADYWAKRFIKRFDTDGDGRISKAEFANARRDRLAMRRFEGEGAIGLEGMSPGPRERIGRWTENRTKGGPEGKEDRKPPEEAYKEAKERRPFDIKRFFAGTDRQFDRLDRDGDGFIDARDLEPVVAERIAFASKTFFGRFDADGDGRVTSEEFNRFAKARFASLDVDSDGRITDADLPPLMRGRGFLK